MKTQFALPPNPSEAEALDKLLKTSRIGPKLRAQIGERAVKLVKHIRHDSDPTMMELFLGEYGLSTEEGVALMCLAEALLRVPDGGTIDALIEDKIAPSEWGSHLGKSHSSLVNASTWALFVTGKVLNDGEKNPVAGVLQGAIKRLGEPVIRQAVTRVMKEMGRQFVLGENMEKAMKRAEGKEKLGFTYSYDMLGEAAKTETDARRYHLDYSKAITSLAKASKTDNIRVNPGISIKLSALHPRYERLQKKQVMEELVPRALSLAVLAKSAGIGFNIDAEEAARLELSLDIFEAILSNPIMKGWDGMGLVVQAYGRRAPDVLDWVYEKAKHYDRRVMVRLVKGAYWDTEIKHAQVEGHDDFPVFTRKSATDVSFMCCAKKLLQMTDRVYPQFATHNAHTVAAVLELAEAQKGVDKTAYEFQRLHGMGEALHDYLIKHEGVSSRIYAPVGAHKDLLAYLVRRLLENGANSSFVNQIVDEDVAPEDVASDPFEKVKANRKNPHNPIIQKPANLFEPERINSRGWDLSDPRDVAELQFGFSRFDKKKWTVIGESGERFSVKNPSTGNEIGAVTFATKADVDAAIGRSKPWKVDAQRRADTLRIVADLFELNTFEIFSLLMREAGKTLTDCIGELREAVDFLRYYADQSLENTVPPAGRFVCISPWNFPLAIFTGQVAAALAMGNAVLAKPAETTSLIADYAVKLFHKAGVPKTALICLPGLGSEVGAALTSDPRINGICFTGSTDTAQHINRSMAKHLPPTALLIAETGGLNAMMVDSTALPEQSVGDVVASAFQSAGQRCSALRILYIQEDIADNFLKMLYGAMDALTLGDPRDLSTDIGPLIDKDAVKRFGEYIKKADSEGRLKKQLSVPDNPKLVNGNFLAPCVISVNGIEDMETEVFGPVLHVATFKGGDVDKVLNAINNKGFGLTFGLHSRIDDRVQRVVDRVHVGNIYINRNQIGAIVGSQPFGGEGLSGTGPKAGGPRYLPRFSQVTSEALPRRDGTPVTAKAIEKAFDKLPDLALAGPMKTELPGPTGESNQYTLRPRGRILCLGPTAEAAAEQVTLARGGGCLAIGLAVGLEEGLDGVLTPEVIAEMAHVDAVVMWSDDVSDLRQALAARNGPIIPLYTERDFARWLITERHICIDTTAAGGNAKLLGS